MSLFRDNVFTEANRQKYREDPYMFSEEFIDGMAFAYNEMKESAERLTKAFTEAEWDK